MTTSEDSQPAVTVPDESYEVYALRYASGPQGQKSKQYYAYELYGDPDGPAGLDFFFWVARSPSRIVLIDSGYDKAMAEEGYFQRNEPNNDPIEVLALMGIRPEDVDHVVVTHMHHDHVGNLDRFPQASFSISRRELEFCTGPLAQKELVTKLFDLRAVDFLATVMQAGRLQLVDDTELLFPGIRVSWVGGHTPGQMIAEMATSTGSVVVASDLVHFYEELERDRPFQHFTDLEEVYRGFETLREMAARSGTSIVPGHDPAVMRRFAAIHADAVVDLTAPIA